jgi:hypothetical protein
MPCGYLQVFRALLCKFFHCFVVYYIKYIKISERRTAESAPLFGKRRGKCGRLAKKLKHRYMTTFASFLYNRWKKVCFGNNNPFPHDFTKRRHRAKALANFKYKLKTIIASRLISWLKLPKRRRKRLQRRNKAL